MHQNRPEIITLLRGQVSCPLLANLAEFGWLDQMSQDPFSIERFPEAEPGVIFSEMAVSVTEAKIRDTASHIRLHTVKANARNIAVWSDRVPWFLEAGYSPSGL